MSQADDIRNFCLKDYIEPARKKMKKGVFICVGDVHKSLNLSNCLPVVCSALGSTTFEECACVKRVHIEGPLNSTSTLFVFLF